MKTKRPKRSGLSVASANLAELVFVVDVSSLTKKGFVGTTTFEGERVELEFDDGDLGVYLPSKMASRLRVRKGSSVSLVIEDERNDIIEATVAGVGKALRISNPKVYYAVGRDGGAIIRVRKS